MPRKALVMEVIGWGFLLWLIGYILGFIFFFFVPANLIGWLITPIGFAITIWVLAKKIPPTTLSKAWILSFVWTAIAIIFDYFLIVKLLKPVDGYYKLDVYVYYTSTFILPIIMKIWKSKRN